VGGIKITPADSAFSKCIRERVGYICEKCGCPFPRSSTGLHASHHHRRGQWGVRFDPLNAESLCYGCHSHYGGTEERMRTQLSDYEYALLLERKEDIPLAKMYRKTKGKGDIAKHFRQELARMVELRELGMTGRIEFEGYL